MKRESNHSYSWPAFFCSARVIDSLVVLPWAVLLAFCFLRELHLRLKLLLPWPLATHKGAWGWGWGRGGAAKSSAAASQVKKTKKKKHSGLREPLKRTPTHRWDIQVERKRANQEESVAKQKNGAKEVAAQQQMKRKQVQWPTYSSAL